jgi:hypothetical protein
LEVVGADDPVEAGLLGEDSLAQELVGRELLVRTEVEVAGGGDALPLPGEGDKRIARRRRVTA